MQLVLNNPYQYYISRMGLLLLATAVMMLFVIYCIVWQVKILRRMSRVLRIREDFSYAMVHDMKTPLSSIIMTLRPLHQGRLDDKPQLRERYFSIAEAEAQHLLALTNKILTLSKLENHRLHLVPEPLPLRPVVEKLAESLAPKCPKPLRISYDLQVETLYADPEFWPEVMQNLLDNAVKYTRPDAEAVEIRISTRPAGRHTTELRIRDNGRGISRRHLRTIFDKYERASAERGRQQDSAPAGFGLGLSFVHQVVRAHGGTIRAESEEGKWTEFVILMKNEESRTKNPGKEEDEEKERNIEYSGKDMEVSVKKSEQGKQVRVKIVNLWKGKGLEINIENSEKGKSVTINRTTKNEENA
ncbi:MAG TPA: HAMP domain-containing histidine kinase [Candidatus Bacteroides pullicola]|uniref:histidine kinase n=1 Tax=Candidatus Bacteroides pullicola TaxID=2838475 RepID=A0A9D1ZFD0_9BACE|nr:HAMP domain-containing histidine kinase [Candidatus Bacteroides pullicola]